MARGLRRFHHSQQSHFLTFSCYHRQPKFDSPGTYDLFVQCLEEMRRRFGMCIYGYVVMPEHVHLLVSEPERAWLADAMHFLKLGFAKRLRAWRPRPDHLRSGKSVIATATCATRVSYGEIASPPQSAGCPTFRAFSKRGIPRSSPSWDFSSPHPNKKAPLIPERGLS